MAKRFFLAESLILICAVGYAQTTQQTIAGNKVPVIELSGNGYQLGFERGRKLKDVIADEFTNWKASIKKNTGLDPDSVISHFFSSTHFEAAIKKWTPDAYEEVKGIADGSGQSFIDVYCFQLPDEYWVYIDKKQHHQSLHCSGIGFAATAQHPTYIAQNLDVEGYEYGAEVLLHIKGSKGRPEQYILTTAGLIAANGINRNNVAICVNTLMDLNASTDGLPVAYVIKGVLASNSSDRAIKFMTTVKHASGQNYIIGTKDSVYDFEASANRVVRFVPKATDPSLVYHTNHAVANTDIKPWYLSYHKHIDDGLAKKDNSVVRFTALQNHLANSDQRSVDLIEGTLRSKDDATNPVCVDYMPGCGVFTFSSEVMTLGGKPSISVTFASPDKSAYVKHEFAQ
jgi:predicted choloylglycine hydrolase